MPDTEMPDAEDRCLLYLITPEQIDDVSAFSGVLEQVLAGGDVACVQLRLKGVSDEVVVATAKALMPVCHKYEVAFILNDRADLAAQVDADGVHLGQEDGDVAAARALLGHNKDIGVTCHSSMHLAFEAGEAGANYVAFGAFFPSKTKAKALPAELSILTRWDEITDVPCVAIGGITAENCTEVANAGAHFVAVCDAVWGHPEGPVAAVKAFTQALT